MSSFPTKLVDAARPSTALAERENNAFDHLLGDCGTKRQCLVWRNLKMAKWDSKHHRFQFLDVDGRPCVLCSVSSLVIDKDISIMLIQCPVAEFGDDMQLRFNGMSYSWGTPPSFASIISLYLAEDFRHKMLKTPTWIPVARSSNQEPGQLRFHPSGWLQRDAHRPWTVGGLNLSGKNCLLHNPYSSY